MSRIPEDLVEKVIEYSDIVDVISSYVPLKKAGRNFKTNCPFHNEKTPSFVVNPTKQIFHCFGCGEGGNVVSFVMKQERFEFPEAIRQLAAKVNIVIPEGSKEQAKFTSDRQLLLKVTNLACQYFYENLLQGKSIAVVKARDYLKRREISLEVVKELKLGFALDQWDGLINYLRQKNVSLRDMEKAGLVIAREKSEGFYDRFRNRIVFSIFDIQGNCRAFGARAMDDSSAKYINSPEMSLYTKGEHLYGFSLSKNFVSQADCIVVVEGYMDFITPYRSGVKNIVASLGTALTIEQIRLMRRYTKNVVLMFDQDKAGQAAMVRSIDLLVEEGLNTKIAVLRNGEDPDSFICKYGVGDFQASIKNAQTFFEYKLSVLSKEHDLSSVEGKAVVCAELLTTIAKCSNEIIRSGYIKELARCLNIEENALWKEMQKLKLSSGKKTAPEGEIKKTQIVSKRMRLVEHNILKLLLEEDSFISATRREVELSDFQDIRVRDVISKVFDLFEKGKEVTSSSVIGSFKDESIQKMISELMARDIDFEVDKEKMHRDYMNRIKEDRIKMQRQELLAQMQVAEDASDRLRLEELKEKFFQLIAK